MKVRPIRKDLFQQIAFAFSVAILIFSVVMYQFIILPDAERRAEHELSITADRTRNTLLDFFIKMESHLDLLAEYASQGYFVADSPHDFQRFAAPLMKNNQSYFAFRVAREDSREIALFRNGDGWSTRFTYPSKMPGVEEWSYWDRNNLLLKKETEKSTYDCRNLPGFMSTLQQQGANAAFWTYPYIFQPNEEPGISASVRFTSSNNVRYVLTLDTSVNNISDMTRYTILGKSGFIALFDTAGAIVGEPVQHAFSQRNSSSAEIKKVHEIPHMASAYEKWGISGKPLNENLFYQADGVSWIARFTHLSLGSHTYYVGVFVPVGDFPPDTTFPMAILIFSLLLALSFAFLWTRQITDKISLPLQQLVSGSKQIGAMDFAPICFLQTRWKEINELALAQDTMRRQIAEAATDLEEKITARTLELQKFSGAI